MILRWPLLFAAFLIGLGALALQVRAQDEGDVLDCDAVLEIWQIQGAGDEANCLRDRVRTEGSVVTAVGPNGFFIQTPVERSDDDPYTSDGVYVKTAQLPESWGIAVGQVVTVDRGRVEEVFGTTMLNVTSASQVEITGEGAALPEPVDLMTVDISDPGGARHPLERYEGMAVIVTDATVQAPTNQFDEFIVTLTDERAFREPGLEFDRTPDLIGTGLPEWDENPEVVEVDPPEMGLETLHLLPGTRVTVAGNLAYNYTDYQIFPSRIDVLSEGDSPVRPLRPREPGEFIIATQNVENFFDLADDPNRDDGPFENYTPLDADAYEVRLSKLSAQVREVLNAPDILAIQEIENARTLSDLILRVYSDDPTLRYAGCILEGNEGRGIDVAYMVRTDAINLLDCYRLPGSLTETQRGSDVLFSRPPLVLEVEFIQDGESFPVTLVNAHIKSLSGIETRGTQERRWLQATRIAQFVGARLAEDPDAHIIVLGDLNAFEFSDGLVDVVGVIAGTHNPADALWPVEDDLVEPDLRNRVLDVPAEDRYSYMFNGSYQVLDHILTSAGLDAIVTDAMFSRGNADAIRPWAEDVMMGGARSSDHDGFAIYLAPFAAADDQG